MTDLSVEMKAGTVIARLTHNTLSDVQLFNPWLDVISPSQAPSLGEQAQQQIPPDNTLQALEPI